MSTQTCTDCGIELEAETGRDYIYLRDERAWFCDEQCLEAYLLSGADYVRQELDVEEEDQ